MEIDGYVTEETVRDVRRLLEKPELRQEMTENNYKIASRYYSMAVLKKKLKSLLTD